MNFDDQDIMEVTLPIEAKEAVRLFHEAGKHAKAGRFDQAVESAIAIEATTFRYWFAFQNEALVGACADCADTGQIERALQICERVAPKYRSAALHRIALACNNFGHFERAFDLARAITDDYVRAMTLTRLGADPGSSR